MAVVTSGNTSRSGSFHNLSNVEGSKQGAIPRYKVGYLTLPDTTDAADTVSIDVFAEFGIIKVLAFEGFVHTTTDSVVAQEAYVANTNSGTNLTLTVPAGTDNDKRFIVIYGI